MRRAEARAFAPASVGNAAVGFDMLGHSVQGPGDVATVRLTSDRRVRVTAIRGVVADLPTDARHNTAGRALLGLARLRPGVGFELELDKGIPLGSGMGGSAASAVAALVAANALLDEPVPLEVLYELAIDGEAAASGSRHGDNVAPMLVGGLVIAPARGAPVRVPVPANLFCALVHPHFVLETRKARAALRGPYQLHDFAVQSEGLALLLAGCWKKDLALVRRGFRDVLVEPRRARLIPGFRRVKEAALDGGALGASISGGGPSVFAWFDSRAKAQAAGAAMAEAFRSVRLGADVLVSKVAGPRARVLRP
ncbi:MAG: homoserine kinase [Myxococcaceae bacterium]|jgi:homoserine kinase|nr:homoserine kinase [Myxococcaceae bacterium]